MGRDYCLPDNDLRQAGQHRTRPRIPGFFYSLPGKIYGKPWWYAGLGSISLQFQGCDGIEGFIRAKSETSPSAFSWGDIADRSWKWARPGGGRRKAVSGSPIGACRPPCCTKHLAASKLRRATLHRRGAVGISQRQGLRSRWSAPTATGVK